MIYLELPDLLRVAGRVLGGEVPVRDPGLLQAALGRPQATFDGADVYPTLELKVAALMHSLAGNRALVDGNKRLALAAMIVFLGVNGRRLGWTNDEAYEVTVAVADGSLDSVQEIAARIVVGTS